MSLYHEAAEVLANSADDGGSLKSRVFRKKNLKSPPNQLYALILETCKWSAVLKEVIDRSQLLKYERKLTPYLALLLVHDHLISKGGIALPQSHGLRAAIEKHKARLASELKLARLRCKALTITDLKEQIDRESADEGANYPRWVRVNGVKSSVEQQLTTTFASYKRAFSVAEVVSKPGKHVFIDPHVPRLLAITPGTDMSKTEAYISGKIILQDKASCFPAYLLDPHADDGDVIDACAAPGNKTTHLAAILYEHQAEFDPMDQTIYAFEKDSKRALTLEKMVKIAGSKKFTRIGMGQDFTRVDPESEKYKNVGALLLDPSCSGSGIVGRDSMPELHLPEPWTGQAAKGPAPKTKSSAGTGQKRKHEHEAGEAKAVLRDDDGNEIIMKSERDLDSRLDSLAAFQLKLLLHAFHFPSARKVTYSTCSVHAQENENVVMRALESDVAKERGWRILERKDQVAGMRDWPVRGVPDYCAGDGTIAEGCIRSYKDDGQGVMGFFVAGFVRLAHDNATEIEDGGRGEGPYARDDMGLLIRDAVTGMPVSRSTGQPVRINDGSNARDNNSTSRSNKTSDASDASSGASSDVSQAEDEEADDWAGFDD